MNGILAVFFLLLCFPAWAQEVAVVDWGVNNRIVKFQEYKTVTEAQAHIARVIGKYPQAFSAPNPGGQFVSWLVNPATKTLLFSPIPPPPKLTVIPFDAFQDRFTGSEFRALTVFVVQRAADGTKPELLQRMLTRKPVDLTAPATGAFIDELVNATPQIITPARKSEILTP